MGTPDFSVPILEALHKSEHEIIQVYTQPPKKNNVAKKLVLHLFIILLIKTN